MKYLFHQYRNTFPANRKALRNKQSGFTLVELLIYLGIFTILITIMTQIFVAIIDSQLESESTTSVAQDGQYLYSRFIYDVHGADDIVSPANLGDTDTELVLERDGEEYTYRLNGSTLEVVDGGEVYALNSTETEVTAVSFQRIGNEGGKHTVRIAFNVSSKTQTETGPESRVFQTTAGLR